MLSGIGGHRLNPIEEQPLENLVSDLVGTAAALNLPVGGAYHEKCVILAKKIKELVDDKAQFADWATRDDIKNQLNMELTVLLYKNGYPPEWDEEVFEKVMEQAENFKRYSDKG